MKSTHTDNIKHQLFNKIKGSPEMRRREKLADEKDGFFT
jgi:hypothetical protein